MTPEELAADYYNYYYAYFTLSDGTDIFATNSEGYFEVEYGSNITYYSAFNSDNETFFSNRYLNPLYGYHYELVPADDTGSYYRVAWKSATKTTYPVPNATVTYYPDGSYVVKDNMGASYFFSYDNSDPNYSDFYYDPSDYNQRWLVDVKPPNMVQVMSLSDRCTIYNSTYTDYSAAYFQA